MRSVFAGIPKGWLRSACSAAFALAVLAGVCFGAQAVALGRPGSAELELVRTLDVLHAHARARRVIAPTGPTEIVICGVGERRRIECPRVIVHWFARELARGARVVRQAVEIGGRRDYVLRVPSARPTLELIVKSSGLPIGLAVLPRERLAVAR